MPKKKPHHPDTPIITAWLKRIFSWKIITGIITLVCFFFAISQFLRDKGGDITASLNGQEVFNNEKINNIIFVDSKNTQIPDIFFPTLINNKEYSVRDFFLQYDIQSNNINLNHSDFYNAYNTGNKVSLRYKDNVLYSFTAVETPIASVYLTGEYGNLDIKMRATYDGISKPYVHEVNNRFYIEPNIGPKHFDEWKNICKQKILKSTDALKFNAYYITQNDFDYETVITTSAIESRDKVSDTGSKLPESDGRNDNTTASETTPDKPISTPEQPETPDKPETQELLIPQNAENQPINITAIDTVTNSDGTLVATLHFTPTGKNTIAYAVFDHVYINQNPKNRRHSTIFYLNIRPNDTFAKIGFSDYHKHYDKLQFAGFATEDSNLAQHIEIKRDNPETILIRNNSEIPVGISYTTKDKFHGAFALGAGASQSFNRQLNNISYLQIPTTEWRETTWQQFMYDADGSLTIWGLIAIIVSMILLGTVLFIVVINLSERYAFFEKYDEVLIGIGMFACIVVLYFILS